jgi:hypothetical protein
MVVSIITVSRVFKTYQGQVRIAELNSKNPVKRAQGQHDHVSISSEAKAALTKHAMGQLLTQLRSSQVVQAEKVQEKNMESKNSQTEEIETKKNEEAASEVIDRGKGFNL